MKYYYTPTTTATTKKTDHSMREGDTEKAEPSSTAGENEKWYSYFGNLFGRFSKSWT